MNYDHVGRPTNEEVKSKKRKRRMMIGIPVVAIVALIGVIASQGRLTGMMGNSSTTYCPNSSWKLENDNTCVRMGTLRNAGSIAATQSIKGDVDKDGVFNTKDAASLRSMIINKHEFNENEKIIYDLDENGVVDINDLDGLLKSTDDNVISYSQVKVYSCPDDEKEESSYVMSDSGSFNGETVYVTTTKYYKLNGDKCGIKTQTVEDVPAKTLVSVGNNSKKDNTNPTNPTSNTNNTNLTNNTSNANNSSSSSTSSTKAHNRAATVTKNIKVELVISIPEGFAGTNKFNTPYKRAARVRIYKNLTDCNNKTNFIASYDYPTFKSTNLGKYVFKNLKVDKGTKLYVAAEKKSEYSTGIEGAIIINESRHTTVSGNTCYPINATKDDAETVKVAFRPKIFFIIYLDKDGNKIKNIRKYVDQDTEKVIDLSQVKYNAAKSKSSRSTGWRARRQYHGRIEYFCGSNEWSDHCSSIKKFVVGDKLNINSPSGDIYLEPIDYR